VAQFEVRTIYPGGFANGAGLFQALDRYFHFYNHQRSHQALGYRTSADLFPPANKEKAIAMMGGFAATRPRPIPFSGKLYGIGAEACATQCYCSLSNSAGSMCRARFTGPATESRPVSAMVNITAPSTNGSCAEAW
jgi:hypothetical protein